jgi:hypothetical protein
MIRLLPAVGGNTSQDLIPTPSVDSDDSFCGTLKKEKH